MGKRNIRLILEYDGSRYEGWQRLGKQSRGMTIQGKLEEALTRMTGEQIEVIGSGRTDRGVHAKAQVANFYTASRIPCMEMKNYLNRYLPLDIGVLRVDDVPERFHSRLNAVSKTYVYRIATGSFQGVFDRKYTFYCFDSLDVKKMKTAASYLIGTHDFVGFSSVKKTNKSTVRTLESIDIEKLPREIRMTFKGNGFLYHMVRIISGTLIEVGRGIRSSESVLEILKKKNRSLAGIKAPAQGLCLVKVDYGEPLDFINQKLV